MKNVTFIEKFGRTGIKLLNYHGKLILLFNIALYLLPCIIYNFSCCECYVSELYFVMCISP